MTAVTHQDLIGVTEVADILGRSVATVKRMAQSGTLRPALKMPGKTGAYLFDRATVQRFADELGVAA